MDPTPKDESIIDIFNTLPSPSPTYESRNLFHNEILHSLLDESEQIPGLRTTPFKYQRRSAALMFQREQGIRYRESDITTKPPTVIGDPRRRTSNNTNFPATSEGVYDSRIGGILAEEMGSGKTLICLMLILASKYLRVEMPGYVLRRTVPCDTGAEEEESHSNVPTLLTLAIRTIMTHSVPWGDRNPDYHDRLTKLIRHQHVKYKYDSYEVTRATSSRLASRPGDVTDVYLSSATIVVVPGNLMIQWEDEILKHTLPADQGGIRYAKVADKSPIPSAEEILQLDVLLISRTRFDREIQDGVDDLGRRRHTGVSAKCSCEYRTSKSSERACSCPKDDGYYSSPLMSVHWKRIIVDEGHSMASKGSNSVLVADKLRVNSKWAVTGTPSSGLYSRTVGEADGSIKVSEASDLRRMGDLVTHFLKLPPWDNKKVRWPSKVADAVSTGLLRSVLERVMIRHRIEDIEREVALPPLHQKFVYVQPGFYEKLTLNLFLAQLATNEVTSERTDQDWLFHPTQRKHLNDFVNNMRECSFYWTGLNRRSVVDMRATAVKYLNEDKVKLEADRELLRQVVRTADLALGDERWRTYSVFHEMGYAIECLPEGVRNAWSMDPSVTYGAETALLGGAQMMSMQKAVSQNAYSGKDIAAVLQSVGEWSMPTHRESTATRDQIIGQKEAGEITETQYELLLKKNKAPQQSLQSKQTKNKKKSGSPKKSTPAKAGKFSPVANGILKKSKAVSEDDYLGPESTLKDTTVAGVTSAKLAYLISRVLEFQEKEKILIFYETDQVAFYIAEALSVVGVNYLLYSRTGLDVHRKAEYLVTFNTTEIFRVFLLDVSQAAQGIHLGSASRVFFVNPIWQPPSVLAQAMKRAHRIGQTKPVYVETLILKDTIEETIFNRKNQMNENDFRGKKLMVDDDALRAALTKEPFVDIVDSQGEMFTRIEVPQKMFGKGKIGDLPEHPDLDIVTLQRDQTGGSAQGTPMPSRSGTPSLGFAAVVEGVENIQLKKKAKKRVGFAVEGEDDGDTDSDAKSGVRFAVESPRPIRPTVGSINQSVDVDTAMVDTPIRRVSLFGGSNGFLEDLPVASGSSSATVSQIQGSVNSLQKRGNECGEEQDSMVFKKIKFVDTEV
ncbi:hypothetical protein H072_733 [Dactylellina haptotyla CBS 200.50]|uniref:Helicase C-terminal domain-containing protein n=1 Tax=Dactylellina haptotyla (strain CBS 200.50) TaxID=1284197 RepID=S8C0L3_DACHA|nr:hypothetical protein H072_733 [Dactylellina haptotyla CBS 200.50]